MGVKTSGFGSVRSRLAKIGARAEEEFIRANRKSAEEIEDLAKALVPEKSGAARLAIRSGPLQGTAHYVDFGPMARILEGDTEQRTTKDGKNRGVRKGTPFANPAIQATRKKRQARMRKAVRGLLKDG